MISKQKGRISGPLRLWRSIRAVRFINVDRCGHAVVQRLLITALACVDASLALAFEVLAVVGNVWVRVRARRASGLQALRQALRSG
jgi:hypothetical protein